MTQEEKIKVLYEALHWFIENDDTNRGDGWEEENAYWIAGFNRGCDALALVDLEEAERLRNASFNSTII
jgi:hypothetical protein